MERFTKVKNIGKGNMGTCALVRNNDDGRHYVIKQVDLAKLNKKERAQSLNEAKVLSVLRHPNVINYNDSFLARKTDHLCIVMEYADGGDLGIKIKAAHGINFSEDQVLDWTIQSVLALIHIHGRKILHRDIKTQNIFLTADGLCKIGDFGIAKALENTVDSAKTFVGTPYYLSPELILEKPYDYNSDVWAFGVCVYESMALKHPFNASDMKGLMQKILRVQYDPLPNCYSPEIRNLVSRLLVKEPNQRIKLPDILRMPFIVDRIKKWLAGGVLPPRYIAALVRFKLLPPGIAESSHPGAGSHQLSSHGNNNNNSSTSLPAINLRNNNNNNNQNQYQYQQQQQYQQNNGAQTGRLSRSGQSNVPSSSHSNFGGGGNAPPLTTRTGSNNINNNFQMNNNNNFNRGGGNVQQQQKLNLPPLGPLGGGHQQQPPQRKGSFSFPAPPSLPRQGNVVGGGNNNNGLSQLHHQSNNNAYQHHGQFGGPQQQNHQGGGAGLGLIRKASGMPHQAPHQPFAVPSNTTGANKLPGLPALPPLGRPQPGSS